MLQWNISGELCGECYGKKLTEHYISAERQTTIKNNENQTIKILKLIFAV